MKKKLKKQAFLGNTVFACNTVCTSTCKHEVTFSCGSSPRDFQSSYESQLVRTEVRFLY